MRDISRVFGVIALIYFILFMLFTLAKLFITAGIVAVFAIIFTGLFLGSLRQPFPLWEGRDGKD